VLQVQHFEAMNCTFLNAYAVLFFAWPVNENMLAVTLNHITQKKKKIENPEWKADVTMKL
jgi:hypothetical protein